MPIPSTNGHVQTRSRLAEHIRSRMPGTDHVVIGAASTLSQSETDDVRAGDMSMVAKLVAGVKFLVSGWIPFGMLTMIVGPPGIGKSAFVLYALVRPIVMGLNWFNLTRGPRQGYVLWCDTEGTGAITVQRLNDWKIPAEWIKVPFEDDPLMPINLTNDEHVAHLRAVILKFETQLVVIDSLRGAQDGDENSSRMSTILQKLAVIAEQTGAAIVIIHHTRKMGVDEEITADSSRGSNAIYAMVRSQSTLR